MTRNPNSNWCYKCGAADTEPAAEKCVNPGWHIPNANAPDVDPADLRAQPSRPTSANSVVT